MPLLQLNNKLANDLAIREQQITEHIKRNEMLTRSFEQIQTKHADLRVKQDAERRDHHEALSRLQSPEKEQAHKIKCLEAEGKETSEMLRVQRDAVDRLHSSEKEQSGVIKELKTQIEETSKILRLRKDAFDYLQGSERAQAREIEELRTQVEETSKMLRTREDAFYNLQSSEKELFEEFRISEGQIKQHAWTIRDYKETIEHLRKSNDDKVVEIKTLKEQVERLQHSHDDQAAEIIELEGDVQDFEEMGQEDLTKIDELDTHVQESVVLIEEALAGSEQQSEEITRLSRENERLRRQIDDQVQHSRLIEIDLRSELQEQKTVTLRETEKVIRLQKDLDKHIEESDYKSMAFDALSRDHSDALSESKALKAEAEEQRRLHASEMAASRSRLAKLKSRHDHLSDLAQSHADLLSLALPEISQQAWNDDIIRGFHRVLDEVKDADNVALSLPRFVTTIINIQPVDTPMTARELLAKALLLVLQHEPYSPDLFAVVQALNMCADLGSERVLHSLVMSVVLARMVKTWSDDRSLTDWIGILRCGECLLRIGHEFGWTMIGKYFHMLAGVQQKFRDESLLARRMLDTLLTTANASTASPIWIDLFHSDDQTDQADETSTVPHSLTAVDGRILTSDGAFAVLISDAHCTEVRWHAKADVHLHNPARFSDRGVGVWIRFEGPQAPSEDLMCLAHDNALSWLGEHLIHVVHEQRTVCEESLKKMMSFVDDYY